MSANFSDLEKYLDPPARSGGIPPLGALRGKPAPPNSKTFGGRSLEQRLARMREYNPQLADDAEEFINLAKSKGYSPNIRSDVRDAEHQRWLHDNGYPTMGNDGYLKRGPHQIESGARAIDWAYKGQPAGLQQLMREYAASKGYKIPASEPWHWTQPRGGQANVRPVARISAPATSDLEKYLDPPEVKRESLPLGAGGQPLVTPPIEFDLPAPEVPPILSPEEYEAQRGGVTPIRPAVTPATAPQRPAGRVLTSRRTRQPQIQSTSQEQPFGGIPLLGRQVKVVRRRPLAGVPLIGRAIEQAATEAETPKPERMYAMGAAPAPGFLEQAKNKILEYAPGLASINTLEGPRTVVAEQLINRALNAASLGIIDRNVDPSRYKDGRERAEAEALGTVAEFASALIPYVGAAKVVQAATKVPRVAKALQVLESTGVGRAAARMIPSAATFGGVETAREAVKGVKGESEGLAPALKNIAKSTATGGVFGFFAPLSTLRRVGAVAGGTFGVEKAFGANNAEAATSAAFNAIFSAMGEGGNLQGKRVRISRDGKTFEARTEYDPQGRLQLKGEQSKAPADVEIVWNGQEWQPRAGQKLLRGRTETQEPPVEVEPIRPAPQENINARPNLRTDIAVPSSESAGVGSVPGSVRPVVDEPMAVPQVEAPKVIIKHSNPAIDGDVVVGKTPDGRLKVQGEDGVTHTVKNPRRGGNREAAIQTVREEVNATQTTATNDVRQTPVDLPAIDQRADAEVYRNLENTGTNPNEARARLAVEQGREAAAADTARSEGVGGSARQQVSPTVEPIARPVAEVAPPTPQASRAAQMFVPPERPQNLTRNFRAGTNDASLTFASEAQRDLYDLAAKSKYQMRGGQNKAGQRAVGDISSLRESVKQHLGVDDAEVMRLAYQVHDDVRAQMKGVKHLEERKLVDNSMPSVPAVVPVARPVNRPSTPQEQRATRTLAAREAAQPTGQRQRVVPSKPLESVGRQPFELTQAEFVKSPDAYNEMRAVLGNTPYKEVGDYSGMTLEQARAIQEIEARSNASNETWKRAQAEARAELLERYPENKNAIEFGQIKRIPDTHRMIVERALRQGKTVPAEVLKDYPDLQSQGQEQQTQRAVPAEKSTRSVVPEISQAFADWNGGRAYVDNAGNYRLKTPDPSAPSKFSRGGQVAPWNKAVKAQFKNVTDFHNAAKATEAPQRGRVLSPKQEAAEVPLMDLSKVRIPRSSSSLSAKADFLAREHLRRNPQITDASTFRELTHRYYEKLAEPYRKQEVSKTEAQAETTSVEPIYRRVKESRTPITDFQKDVSRRRGRVIRKQPEEFTKGDVRDAAVISARRSKAPVPDIPVGLRPERKGERGAVNFGEVYDVAVDALNAPRSLMSSFDLSAPLRQGAIFTVTEPKIALQALRNMFRAAHSKLKYNQVGQYLATHPLATEAENAGLYLSILEQAKVKAKQQQVAALRAAGQPIPKSLLTVREEAFMSRLAGKLPHVKLSEQAYVSYLDTMRMEAFAKYVAELQAKRNATPESYKAIAKFINYATGRGDLFKLNDIAPELATIFFSPRYMASRFEILNPAMYARLPKGARQIAIRKMLEAAGLFGLTLALFKLAGGEVSLDPESPDFLKVKFGDTRYDFMAGFQQPIRYIYRMVDAMLNKNSKGDPINITKQFLRYKLAPAPSLAVDWRTGKTAIGEKFIWKDAALDRVLPMMKDDWWDVLTGKASTAQKVGMPLAFFGVGTNTYKAREKEAKKAEPARSTRPTSGRPLLNRPRRPQTLRRGDAN